MIITGAAAVSCGPAKPAPDARAASASTSACPSEAYPNEFIADDPKLMTFRYFFTRKLLFVKEANAVVLFPGGFGTLDETYECLTLVQTGKAGPMPIVFIDDPWRDVLERLARTTSRRPCCTTA